MKRKTGEGKRQTYRDRKIKCGQGKETDIQTQK